MNIFFIFIKKLFWTSIFSMVLILLGCNVSFSGDYENTPEGNFDFFFYELENIYAYNNYTFENGLTLNQIKDLEKTNLMVDPSWDNLFQVLNRVIYTHITDPHVNLIYPLISYSVQDEFWKKIKQNRPGKFDTTYTPYFSPSRYPGVISKTAEFLDYAVLSTNGQNLIGYIYIKRLDRTSDFGIRESNKKIASTVDSILRGFQSQGVDRIIVDIRSGTGGSAFIAEIIASRFVNRTVKYAVFEEPTSKKSMVSENHYISPKGYPYFQDKPLVILINTLTCSAGEILLLMLRQSGGPNRVIGVPTLGCPGSTLHRELPNGWIFQVTVTRSKDEKGGEYFRTGIPPDIIQINVSKNDDAVLDLAVDTVSGL